MTEEKENIENKVTEETNVSENSNKEEQKNSRSNPFRALMDGTLLSKEILRKQFPFVLFLTLIAIAFIANRYAAEKIVRNTETLKTELKELRAEQISVTSELMQLSQQSEVVKLVTTNQLGLSESIDPPKKIIVKEKE
ncbi:MAG: hypothetical protein HY951_16335 [Bacteroidia bacterium]|nr:hypothetical protein [Bacteroidia bacterium]